MTLNKNLRFDFQEVKSEDLKVGDLIYLQNKQTVPADCIIFKSEDELGLSYI
jgi:magnesium-transporting ATPase (P-type)